MFTEIAACGLAVVLEQVMSNEPQQEISLDELTEAFAHAMGIPSPQADSEQDAPDEPSDADELQDEPDAEPVAEAADPCPVCPGSILEAMLFVGSRTGEPLPAHRAAELMRGVEPGEVTTLVDKLNRRYTAGGCPYHIVSEGAGYQLTLRKAYHPLRNRFYGRVRMARLSQAAIDVLAIVAYRQPLTAEQVGRLRGKPSGHVLTQLVRRGLLKIERQQTGRRIAKYFTTERFLKLFDLKSLDELPQSEELDR